MCCSFPPSTLTPALPTPTCRCFLSPAAYNALWTPDWRKEQRGNNVPLPGREKFRDRNNRKSHIASPLLNSRCPLRWCSYGSGSSCRKAGGSILSRLGAIALWVPEGNGQLAGAKRLRSAEGAQVQGCLCHCLTALIGAFLVELPYFKNKLFPPLPTTTHRVQRGFLCTNRVPLSLAVANRHGFRHRQTVSAL